MKRTNIYLAEDRSRLLRHLAIEQQRSFTDIVREALEEYLSRRGLVPGAGIIEPPEGSPDDDWQQRIEAVLNRIRSAIPEDMDPDQIEEEITAARDEVRRQRSARGPLPRG